MEPAQLLRTIYLGDRACKGITIESWNSQVRLRVDVISRIRNTSGLWDFYSDEDITDGELVFTGVSAFRMDPSGPLPNDLINDIRVTDVNNFDSRRKVFLFQISVGSVDQAGNSTEVIVQIEADGIHLQDPIRPGEAIQN